MCSETLANFGMNILPFLQGWVLGCLCYNIYTYIKTASNNIDYTLLFVETISVFFHIITIFIINIYVLR